MSYILFIIDNENTLCSQLLLHPPFKPKRLIHLCPDGSIQVLSTIDENSNENQIINPEQYHLNYSNSAIIPSIQQSHSKNEILFDHLIRDNNSILALQHNSDDSKTISQDNDPIVKINLDFNDETIEGNSEDEENSLPEIFFKRIIAPESEYLRENNVINRFCMLN